MLQEQLAEVARSSLWRSLTKWGAGHPQALVAKPVAILSAFRDAYPLEQNRARNDALRKDIVAAGLSYYPVFGSGQESKRCFMLFKLLVPTKEESFVVQPRGEMDEDTFCGIILKLIQNYEQDVAAVKLSSDPRAFLLFPDGQRSPMGDTAIPRGPDNPFYSELPKGPRAPDSQLSPWELHGERNPFYVLANQMRGRPELNQPINQRHGRRFAIDWRRPDGGKPNA